MLCFISWIGRVHSSKAHTKRVHLQLLASPRMVSDEVCGVVQGRFEFCGGIKSGEVMDGYGCIYGKLIVCKPVAPTNC